MSKTISLPQAIRSMTLHYEGFELTQYDLQVIDIISSECQYRIPKAIQQNTCPTCRTYVKTYAKFCHKCGQKFL